MLIPRTWPLNINDYKISFDFSLVHVASFVVFPISRIVGYRHVFPLLLGYGSNNECYNNCNKVIRIIHKKCIPYFVISKFFHFFFVRDWCDFNFCIKSNLSMKCRFWWWHPSVFSDVAKSSKNIRGTLLIRMMNVKILKNRVIWYWVTINGVIGLRVIRLWVIGLNVIVIPIISEFKFDLSDFDLSDFDLSDFELSEFELEFKLSEWRRKTNKYK